MYTHVLACVDGSYDSEVAAKYAMGLAYEASARFSIVHVQTGAKEGADESLARLERIAKRRSISPEIFIKHGDRLNAIREVATTEHADAIVASTGGKVVERGILSHNLAYDLINSMPQTVFIVKAARATTAREHQKIVCPIRDLHANIDERIEALSLISHLYERPVSLLRCYKIQPDRFLTTKEEQRIHTTMRSYLAPLEERLSSHDVSSFIHTRICYSVREEILDFIERNHYDLLFLRVEPSSFFSFIRKDFAIEVMKRSECNVILWKPRRA